GLILIGVSLADIVRWKPPYSVSRQLAGSVAGSAAAAALLLSSGVTGPKVVAYTVVVFTLAGAWLALTALSVNSRTFGVWALVYTGLLFFVGIAASGSGLTLDGPLANWFDGLAPRFLTM